jgi:transcriptional regulator of acetoin/glycerol metabolism
MEIARADAARLAVPVQSRASLMEAEKRAIVEALQKTKGNKKQAAAMLGIHRPTLYAKMKRHGLVSSEPA